MSGSIATWADTTAEEDAMNDDHAPLWRRMIALSVPAGDLQDKAVLDFGCNQGGFLEMLYRRAPYKEGTGVDIAASSVAVAKQRLAKLPVTLGSPDILEKKSAHYDTVFSHEVFYLLPDLAGHAALLRKILKPGGVYFAAIGCHTDQPLWPSWKVHISSYSNVKVQDYSLDDYAGAFFDAGFKVSAQPYRMEGFFPLKPKNPYFPKVADSLRYYDNDKVLFRFERSA